jgi:tetratricopeptide (TPR) repeat protein
MRAALIALLLLSLASPPAPAEEAREPAAETIKKQSPAEARAETLDRLFARLHQVKSGDEAQLAEQAIWQLWMRSDSPTAELLLKQATEAMNKAQFDASLAVLDRLVAVHPDFAEAWNKRATLYFMMGRYEESLADIDKVLDIEPRHFGALSGRGMIYRQEGKYSDALAAFRDALAVNPSMGSVRNAVEELEKLEQPI